jgi:23S rRNA pseudouridine1911/1915/1917 synthase
VVVRFRVTQSLPYPARTVLGAVQVALRISKSAAQQVIRQGAVSCQGRLLSQSHLRMDIGDEIEIEAVQPVQRRPAGRKGTGRSNPRFEIVCDDPSFIVVNKPAGLLTVPTQRGESNTLQTQIRKWLSRQEPGAMAVCIHRLDRLVSGLLVFAKNYAVADQLRSQFASRKPQRTYAAVVRGSPSASSGTIRSYLSTDDQLNRVSSADPEAGELAVTHYRLVERWGDVSLLEVRLETGRRNQIRVQLAEIGNPILGDPRYGSAEAQHPQWPHKRIALHAESLAIQHPETGQVMRFKAPWPQEFRDLRRQLLRKHS